MKVHSLPPSEISSLLERQRRPTTLLPDHVPVHELFEEILRIANQFVPSESGSVLIDDPRLKIQSPEGQQDGELVFVACFGAKSASLLGRRLRGSEGIVGRAYQQGRPVLSHDTRTDDDFFEGFDRETAYETRTVVCVPICIGNSTIGVLELINRIEKGNYEQRELDLLQIFADYISTTLQNVLDANRYRELAKRDDLTGLYNDRYFNQRLSEEVERAERDGNELSLIFLDLDHFKGVNDKHGHLVGSQTLREVGLILGRTILAPEATVARYGGDEFVAIIPHFDLERALELAEEVRQRIGYTLYRVDPGLETGAMLRPGVITASIGVSSYRMLEFAPTDRLRKRKNEFIRVADQSMYEAKARGKNRVCWGSYRAGQLEQLG